MYVMDILPDTLCHPSSEVRLNLGLNLTSFSFKSDILGYAQKLFSERLVQSLRYVSFGLSQNKHHILYLNSSNFAVTVSSCPSRMCKAKVYGIWGSQYLHYLPTAGP